MIKIFMGKLLYFMHPEKIVMKSLDRIISFTNKINNAWS